MSNLIKSQTNGGSLFTQGRGQNQNWKKKQSNTNDRPLGGERILRLERAADATIGIHFSKGFFDIDLKDLIKEQSYSKYDAEKKIWFIPVHRKEELLSSIQDYCMDKNVLIDDIPPFVGTVLNTPVPFYNAGTKFNKVYKFNYEHEIKKENQKSVGMLPEKISGCLYRF